MGVIALWAAVVSFIGAGLMLILSVLGFVHARFTPLAAEFLPGRRPGKVTAS
jgi:hypothetical protein